MIIEYLAASLNVMRYVKSCHHFGRGKLWVLQLCLLLLTSH